MFDIIVTNKETANLVGKEWKATKIISLVDPGLQESQLPNAAEIGADHFVRYFNDIAYNPGDSAHLMVYDGKRFVPVSMIPPSKELLTEILAFGSTFTDADRVLIHCHAGISRSTSTAIALAIQGGAEVETAVLTIGKMRPIMRPNAMMIQMYDELLGLNGRLEQAVADWALNQLHFEAKARREYAMEVLAKRQADPNP